MAAGLAVVGEVISKNLSRKSSLRGKYLRRRLKAHSEEFGFTELRGTGLLQAVDLPEPRAAEVAKACMGDGLLLNAPRPNTLRFMPALTVSNKEVDEMIDILTAALRRVM